MTASTSPDHHLAEALGTRYWREEQARVVLVAWASSGESMAAFARRHELTVQRLRWWKRWLMPTTTSAVDEGDALDATFLPVHVVGREVATEPIVDVSAAERLEVVVRGGRVIRVPDGFEPRTLARVVQTLEALAC
jgi:hypothetical protein